MVTLCQNRPEGFGPYSSLHPRLPTTCFLDVIVVPLATWLFMALMLAMLIMRMVASRRPHHLHSPVSSKAGAHTHPRSVLSRVLAIIYYLLILAMLAMVSLEIARLVVAKLGIGLLPFTYLGVLIALANRIAWRSRTVGLVSALYWIMLAATMALKVAAEQAEQMGPGIRAQGVGVQGMYPTSDEVLDNSVMVGVELLLAVLEVVESRRVDGL
jgi:hypothetical protein